LVEEFILRVASKDKDIFTTLNLKVTLHPHCHQRAERPADDGLPTGTAATASLLREIGFDVDVIDAGCCGMAGTFGYDAEHYELSMQVGELGVLPKVREAEIENREVVSTGSACRMQIRQGAGVKAEHPLVLMARSLRN
jgi:Fe-S oxidoreductase